MFRARTPLTRALGPAAALVVTCAAAGCQSPEVGYSLRFPSEETFLLSSTATVDVYDGSGTGDQSPDAICRALSVGQPAPVNTMHSTGKRDVCDFLAGELLIDNVDVGRVVLFAEAEDGAGSLLLRGCSVVDVLPQTEQVEVQLSTLPSYPDTPATDCPNQQAKCQDRSC
jgi:hypothetical protein